MKEYKVELYKCFHCGRKQATDGGRYGSFCMFCGQMTFYNWEENFIKQHNLKRTWFGKLIDWMAGNG